MYLRTGAPSKNSDQPAPSHTLIRIFTEGILDVKDAKFLHADNEDFDQTARMRRLIWVLVRGTFQKVRFRTFRHMYLMVRYTSVSQRTIKPTIRLVRPAKTQIRLRIRAVWSESSLIASLLKPLGYPKRDKREPLPYSGCGGGGMFRLSCLCWSHRSYYRSYCS